LLKYPHIKILTAMKRRVRILLHSILGLPTYLYFFSLYKVRAISKDPYEKHVFVFRDLIPKNSLILDVGANLGFVTYHLAQREGCRVISFEPIPVNLQVIHRLVARKRLANVAVFPYALGNESGQVTMLLPSKKGSLMSGLSRVIASTTIPDERPPHDPLNPLTWPGKRFDVALKTLDELEELSATPFQIGGIKIDAEGYEYFILEGGRSIIQQHKPVILVELWKNENRHRSLALLAGLGYTIFTPTSAGLVRLEEQDWQTDEVDFICLTQPELIAQLKRTT
jgi:FkbM family methyltransferase